MRLKSSENIIDDPHVTKVAKMGNEDEDYVYLNNFIKKNFPITSVNKESDLFAIQGDYDTLSLHKTDEGEIITKNASEVLIPRNYRQELKALLHSTHLLDAGMLALAKNKFFWPNI